MDKQMATLCGRPWFFRLWDLDASLPSLFSDADGLDKNAPSISLTVTDNDVAEVQIFRQFIHVSAVLELALGASSHPPIFNNSTFLGKLSRQLRSEKEDAAAIAEAGDALEDFTRYVTLSKRSFFPIHQYA